MQKIYTETQIMKDFLTHFQPGSWAAPLNQELMNHLCQNPLEAMNPSNPIESVVRIGQELTIQNFNFSINNGAKNCSFDVFPGWRMLMYAPIYVSSFCVNHCLYCGFHVQDKIERTKLTVQETLNECQALFDHQYRNILIVAGESDYHVPISYLAEIIEKLCERNAVPSIEIAPQSVDNYAILVNAGCSGITLFQETYDEQLYPVYHPKGPKSNFLWRYNSQRRAAEAGMKRLGFGFLVGLAEPVNELKKMIEQAKEVQTDFPNSKISFGLPRIREAPDHFQIKFSVEDETFLRMYIALRCAFPEAELVTSTREMPRFRDQLLSTCITWVSAGSSTRPGGYIVENGLSPLDGFDPALSLASQFPITDHRSVKEVAQAVIEMNHQIAW